MVALSISVESWNGLTWAQWKRWVVEVEQLGFAGLYCSDHFSAAPPPARDAPELVVLLSYLADHSTRIPFGPLIAPLSLRDPVILARQAIALDDLSGGRLILGMGAGWNEPEHVTFGYELGDVPTRMARLGEGLEVITRLLRAEEPARYAGRFYRLHDALLRPPRPGGPPILIGGSGPKYTLPLVARYADIWNATQLRPDTFRERSGQLDALLAAVGRPSTAVKRTLTTCVVCARDASGFERWVRGLRGTIPAWASLPIDEVLALLRPRAIVGSPDEVIAQIRAYGEAGVTEVMGQWVSMDDFEGLQLLAEEVLPHI